MLLDLRQRSMGQSLADGDSHQRKAGIRMYCLRADPLGGKLSPRDHEFWRLFSEAQIANALGR